MKRELSYVQTGLAVISLVIWFLLPFFSFVIVVPLFNISGWNLCMHINQLMLIPLLFGLTMVAAALLNHRSLMIVSGILQAVMIIVTIIFRKDILLGGNLKWIYSSAQLLLTAIPNLEISGVQITPETLTTTISLISDNYMQVGIGMIIHALLTFVYILVSFVAPQQKSPMSSGPVSTSGSGPNPTFTPNRKTGYQHRT